MRRRLPAFCRDHRAVVTLDFALLAVPLLMLVFGTVEFGRLLWAREALQMTAIQGARCMGVLQPSCVSSGAYSATSTRSYIEGVAHSWGITLTDAAVTLNLNAISGPCSGLSTSVSEVSISYTFQTAVPGLLTLLSGGSALTGHACFPRQS